MSTSAEQEMRQRLSAVLDDLTPGPAPVAVVIRRGRTVRRRRIAGVTAAGLAAAAAVAGFSSLGLRLPSTAPESPRPPVVTVVPPGPGAPAGQIASGTVGREHWSVRVTVPRHGLVCLKAGPAGIACGLSASPVNPADLEGGMSAHGYRVLGGPVKPRVTRVKVLLTDGQRLNLHPVAAYGQRWVAFALPLQTRVSKAVAYSGQAVYRYAIPWNESGPNTFPSFSDWLPPGSAGLPRRVFQVASGTADGRRWTATEYTGPWGRCFAVPGASECVQGAGPRVEAGRLTLPMFSVPDGVHLVSVVPAVASLRLDLSSGQQLRVVTHAGYGGQRFYAFVLPHGTGVVGWTAYDSAGVKLGSGPGATAG